MGENNRNLFSPSSRPEVHNQPRWIETESLKAILPLEGLLENQFLPLPASGGFSIPRRGAVSPHLCLQGHITFTSACVIKSPSLSFL